MHRFPRFLPSLIVTATYLATTGGLFSQNPEKIEGTDNPDPIPSVDSEKALLSTITVADGLVAALFAREPHVQEPTAITFDEQNRLYVAETRRFDRGIVDNRRNQHWLIDELALEDTAGRLAMYQKYSDVTPMEYYTEHSETIRVLEDTTGDGKADEVRIFADGFNDPLDGTAAGIMALDGKIYFACIPHIWLLEDSTGDGISDKRSSLQDGYGISVSLSGHDLNGFALGPDGRIYFTIGDRGFNLHTREGKHLYDQYGGAIFRMEQDGSKLEVVHDGLRNPKEIAFDQYGNAFSVDNNADMGDLARVVQMVEGAYSGWHRGHQNFRNFRHMVHVTGRHEIPWMEEGWWEMEGKNRPQAVLPPSGFISTGPSGLAYNPGSSLAKKWDNHFFVCDFRGGLSSVLAFEMEPEGAGFKLANNETFISGILNTDIEFGYDGKIYVSDYTGSWPTHGEGAIYTFHDPEKITESVVGEVRQIFADGFSERESAELAALLGHQDLRVRQRAQFELAKDAANRNVFEEATDPSKPLLTRLHGLWGLAQLGRLHDDKPSVELLAKLSGDPEWRLRGQAVLALGELAPVAKRETLLGRISDENPHTRMLASIALAKAGDAKDIPRMVKLLEDNNGADSLLSHAGSYGLELISKAIATTDGIHSFAGNPSPAVRRDLVVALRRLKDPGIVRFLEDKEPTVVIETIQAINDAYIETARPALAEATGLLGISTPMIDYRIVNAIFRVGGDAGALGLLDIAANKSIPEDTRIECLWALRRWENPPLADPTTGKYRPISGERSLQAIAPEIRTQLLTLLGHTEGKLLSEAIDTARHFKVEIPSTILIGHIENANNLTAIRLAALGALLNRQPNEAISTLTTILNDRDAAVRQAALNAIVTLDPPKAFATAAARLSSKPIDDRQHAYTILARLEQAEAAALLLNHLQNISEKPAELHLDILEACGKRNEAEIQNALEAYHASLDPEDPLAAYRIALTGGNAERGRNVFYNNGASQCFQCHAALPNRRGGDAGPDLQSIGKTHDARYILESLILPNASIAAGYGLVSLTLKDGNIAAGKLVKDGEEEVIIADLTTNETSTHRKSEIETFTSPMSTMPPMGEVLKKAEPRDLMAFLLSLKH